MGPSGAGKTTLFALVERFYEPTSGRIELDGTAIATLSRAVLRNRVAYVEQDATLLAGTLRQTSSTRAPNVTEAEITGVLAATPVRVRGRTCRRARHTGQAVGAAAERCTVVMIAHRLSTVVSADRIVVMDGGTVRAVGRHGELLRSDDLYRELASTQLLVPADTPVR